MSRMTEFCDSVEKSIADENYYAALIVSLTLPDIAGWIENPNAGSRDRYVDWFTKFIEPKYTSTIRGKTHCFLNGSDCYALRCSLLHEGRDDTSSQRAHDATERFQFYVPERNNKVHCNKAGKKLQLQPDLFCRDICDGVNDWLITISGDSTKEERIEELLSIQFGGNLVIKP